jgi:hypothetical protein
MTVYVLLREDQNSYGYIDVAVDGVFVRRGDAEERLDRERDVARGHGLLVCDEAGDGEWDVSWSIEEHPVTAGA